MSTEQVPLRTLVTIVIPCYNEQATVRELVETVRHAALPSRCLRELILVDDCSTDDTGPILASLADEETRVFSHDKNQGKGAALRTGFSHARGDIVLIQDADLEYSPSEYPRLLKPILEGKADVVYGSRFLPVGEHRVLYFWHYLGNRFLTTLSNVFTDLNLSDMETCYKVFRKEIIDKIRIEENRFGFEPEITAKIAKQRCRIYEVGISYYGRTYEEGKKIGWRDGVRALWCIVKYNIFR
ncbi:MAG: glycosyltransferase family 2 protein [Bacteroidia bacterium]|nr:glycosyltransferase family 2 protein [Bacteroidia bacterium]